MTELKTAPNAQVAPEVVESYASLTTPKAFVEPNFRALDIDPASVITHVTVPGLNFTVTLASDLGKHAPGEQISGLEFKGPSAMGFFPRISVPSDRAEQETAMINGRRVSAEVAAAALKEFN